jgi:hypothetical protein
MKDPTELLEACRALLPHLETSSDPVNTGTGNAGIDFLKLSDPERLRFRADAIEAREAAIWRFRKTMEAYEVS